MFPYTNAVNNESIYVFLASKIVIKKTYCFLKLYEIKNFWDKKLFEVNSNKMYKRIKKEKKTLY